MPNKIKCNNKKNIMSKPLKWKTYPISLYDHIFSQKTTKIWSFPKLILYTKFIGPMDQMDVYKYFIYLYHCDIYGRALCTKIGKKNDSEFMGQQSHRRWFLCVVRFSYFVQWYNISIRLLFEKLLVLLLIPIIAPGIQWFCDALIFFPSSFK